MAWVYLIIAGILEIVWAAGMKYTVGFTRPAASIIVVVASILSVVFLAQSVKTLPVGTAYVIWTGIGAIGTAIFGIIFFNESREFSRIFCLFLILAGIIGLKLFSNK